MQPAILMAVLSDHALPTMDVWLLAQELANDAGSNIPG